MPINFCNIDLGYTKHDISEVLYSKFVKIFGCILGLAIHHNQNLNVIKFTVAVTVLISIN